MREFAASNNAFRMTSAAPSICGVTASDPKSLFGQQTAAANQPTTAPTSASNAHASAFGAPNNNNHQNGLATGLPYAKPSGMAGVDALTPSETDGRSSAQSAVQLAPPAEFASIRNNTLPGRNIGQNNVVVAGERFAHRSEHFHEHSPDAARNATIRDDDDAVVDSDDRRNENGTATRRDVPRTNRNELAESPFLLRQQRSASVQTRQLNAAYLDRVMFEQQQRHYAHRREHQQQQVETTNFDSVSMLAGVPDNYAAGSGLRRGSYESSILAGDPQTGNAITAIQQNYVLWFLTPIVASFAVAIVVASLAGPQWMLTEERQLNPAFNGTPNPHRPDDGMFLLKYTKSSLWIMCTSSRPGSSESTTCQTIDYFPLEEYSPDPNDSTMAIPYAITRSTPFFIISAIALLISYLVLIVAMCAPHQHHVYFFTSGILFIISGLIMLIGLIMYISIFKAEIGSKLRPKSPLQPPVLTFEYGQSFCLYVFGFILTEMAGVLNVFLFIGLQQMRIVVDQRRSIPCFLGVSAFPDKVRDLDCNAVLGRGKESALSMSYYSPLVQKRVFLEKSRNCEIHYGQANAPNTAGNRYGNADSCPRKPSITYSTRSASQQFPLTRSVSTATELFEGYPTKCAVRRDKPVTSEQMQNDRNGRKQMSSAILSQSTHHLPAASTSMNSVLGGNYAQRIRPSNKDDMFREFCERAGRRYNPKEIYFIDVADDDDDDNAGRTAPHQAVSQNYNNLYASNSSLHKSYPKNLFELEQRGCGIQNNIRAKHNQHAQWRQSNDHLSLSQTLPRNFLKQNSDAMSAYRAQFEQQQQLQHQHQLRCTANGRIGDTRSSHDNLLQHQASQVHERMRAANSKDDIVSWPNAIPASPSSFSTRSQYYSRIPNAGQAPPAQNHHRYGALNQQADGPFDLDRMECERRKSHASLFESALDYENGTAV